MKLHKLIYFFLVFSGCAYYSLNNTIPPHINNVFVSPIENDTSEFNLSELLSDKFYNVLLKENILESTLSLNNADSKLDINILQIIDSPDVLMENASGYEFVNQWKITIKVKVSWNDLANQNFLIDKIISESVIYNFKQDIGTDNIDNDLDGFIDADDVDESFIGSPRDGALMILIDKISKNIINELTSVW